MNDFINNENGLIAKYTLLLQNKNQVKIIGRDKIQSEVVHLCGKTVQAEILPTYCYSPSGEGRSHIQDDRRTSQLVSYTNEIPTQETANSWKKESTV